MLGDLEAEEAMDHPGLVFYAHEDSNKRWVKTGTDGSGLYPSWPWLARGGAGLFFAEGHPKNVSAPVMGPLQTAQRGEVLALLLALLAAWMPIHIISDSEFATNLLLALLAGGSLPNDLVHDDLWIRIGANLDRLGLDNVRVTWVPSHTTVDDVYSGKISPENRLLNFGADAQAAAGAAQRAPPVAVVARAKRQRQVAIRWQKTMVDIVQTRDQARPLPGREAGFSNGELQTRRVYPNSNNRDGTLMEQSEQRLQALELPSTVTFLHD